MSYPICRDLDQQKQFFEGVFCRALTTVNLSTGGDYRPAVAEIVSGNYFQVLGVGPALGQCLDERRRSLRRTRIRWLSFPTTSGRRNSEALQMWSAGRCW